VKRPKFFKNCSTVELLYLFFCGEQPVIETKATEHVLSNVSLHYGDIHLSANCILRIFIVPDMLMSISW
jgi:hypothetical protein